MLVRFTLENWLSFRDETTLNLIATRERQHRHRVPRLDKYGASFLPIAAICGGNASGKTNLCMALRFAQGLVVKGTEPDEMIHTEPYLLDPEAEKRPCRFRFELLADETIYEYGFAVADGVVVDERLASHTKTSEKVLYHRRGGKPNFHTSLAKDQFLHFAFQGTRDNQLFLTNAVSQNIANFRPVYDWFKERLRVHSPSTGYGALHRRRSLRALNRILPLLDTGIQRLESREIPAEEFQIPDDMASLLDELPEGASFGPAGFHISRRDGKPVAHRLATYHRNTEGEDVEFRISLESAGTLRLLRFLPGLLEAASPRSPKTYVLDEIDRSLHTELSRALLEAYLEGCTSDSRSQLVLTTHDTELLDQNLLRRDEMWRVERDPADASELVSFSDYAIRHDKDIRKIYLMGRMGGTPRIALGGSLSDFAPVEESLEDG